MSLILPQDGEDTSEVTALISEDGEVPVALPLTSYQQRGARDLVDFLNNSYFDKNCQHTELNIIYESFSPYLYPFTIEYSILIGKDIEILIIAASVFNDRITARDGFSVGILYIIWNNIGNCQRGGGSSPDGQACPPLAGPSSGTNIVVHVDCHHANRGLFAGLLVLVGSIVSIILFFVAFTDP